VLAGKRIYAVLDPEAEQRAILDHTSELNSTVAIGRTTSLPIEIGTKENVEIERKSAFRPQFSASCARRLPRKCATVRNKAAA
jgi:hypothetical protein